MTDNNNSKPIFWWVAGISILIWFLTPALSEEARAASENLARDIFIYSATKYAIITILVYLFIRWYRKPTTEEQNLQASQDKEGWKKRAIIALVAVPILMFLLMWLVDSGKEEQAYPKITRDMVVGTYEAIIPLPKNPNEKGAVGFVFLENGGMKVYAIKNGKKEYAEGSGNDKIPAVWKLVGTELHVGNGKPHVTPENPEGVVKTDIYRIDLNERLSAVESLTGIGRIYGTGENAIRDIWDEEFVNSNPPFTSRPVLHKIKKGGGLSKSGESEIEKIKKKYMKDMAWCYFADPPEISEGDFLILQRWGSHGTAWNRASAPIVREFLDQSVSSDDFIKTADMQLRECRAVIYKMSSDWESIENEGVKKTLKPLVEVQGKLINNYTNLREAAATGNADEQIKLWANAVSLTEEKKKIFMPIWKRLRKTLPADVADRKLRELQDDIYKRLAPKKK